MQRVMAAIVLALLFAASATGQTPIGEAPVAAPLQEIPTRGMTMENVEASFGEPQSRRPPVGDPPITRWEYPGFIVYFEYKRVIHSVAKRPVD